MATTTIPWGDGSSDNIYLTYPSESGDQTVTVSSDANTGAARSKVVTFASGVGNITQQLTVNQAAGVVSVPYIRGGADGSYIDTGITPDNTTRIVLWARNVNPGTAFNWVFGSRVANQNAAFALAIRNEGGTGGIRACFGNENVNLTDKWPLLSHYHKYELSADGFYVDDTLVSSVTSYTFSNNYNLYLFDLNNAGSPLTVAVPPIDICACKIYKGGVLVRDYTAVNSPSVGLYDSISGTVFTNAGSGSFTYGTFSKDAYTPLEYISCTNAQYIDTGIFGKKSLSVVVKFQVRGTSLGNNSIFGTMRSGTSGTYFLLQTGNATYKNRYMNFYIDGTTNNQIYNNNSTKLTNLDVVFVKDDTTARLVRNNATFGTSKTFTASSSFSTSPDTLALCGLKVGGAYHAASLFNGYLYYAGFGGERNYVPAKVGGVAGLYDTYNDVFYPSVTSTPFIAGNEL